LLSPCDVEAFYESNHVIVMRGRIHRPEGQISLLKEEEEEEREEES